MKTTTTAAALFLLTFTACDRKATVEVVAAPPLVTTAPITPTPVVASKTTSTTTTVTTETRVAPPATPEIAPAGVFYLLATINVQGPEGIVGLPPGTGVKLVRPGVYLTPAGEQAIDSSILTNDMTKARAVRDTDRAIQSELKK